MKIIFSPEYQQMLGENGLGPANLDYASSLGDDQFAKALIESAADSKLTPAAPGWAAVEGAGILEEFFGKISAGGDVKALAAEYDEKLERAPQLALESPDATRRHPAPTCTTRGRGRHSARGPSHEPRDTQHHTERRMRP